MGEKNATGASGQSRERCALLPRCPRSCAALRPVLVGLNDLLTHQKSADLGDEFSRFGIVSDDRSVDPLERFMQQVGHRLGTVGDGVCD